jgi:hypothetical protein
MLTFGINHSEMHDSPTVMANSPSQFLRSE